jgi:hypothetical protein
LHGTQVQLSSEYLMVMVTIIYMVSLMEHLVWRTIMVGLPAKVMSMGVIGSLVQVLRQTTGQMALAEAPRVERQI